jgi:hypothetical protein
MKPKKLPRFLILAAGFVLITLAVMWRQSVIRQQRSVDIVSTVAEWQKNGKPVIINIVQKENVPIFAKFTVEKDGADTYRGYITKSVFEQIGKGQKITVQNGDTSYEGRIESIDLTAREDTGLFGVKVAFVKEIPDDLRMPVCFAETNQFNNVLRIASDTVINDGERYFVWTADADNKARKKEIKVGSKNGYGLIVAGGISEGDRLIVKGMSALKEGDLINVLNK